MSSSALTRRSYRWEPSSGFLLWWSFSPWPYTNKYVFLCLVVNQVPLGYGRAYFLTLIVTYLCVLIAVIPIRFWPNLLVLSEKKAHSRLGKEIGSFALLGQAFWVGLVCCLFFFSPLGVQQGFHMQEIQELLASKLIVLPHYLDSFLGLPHFPHRS